MESINWTTIILTLGTAIITAFATLFASWIAQKTQRRIKEIEIVGQQEIKAKELLFENYQRRIDRYSEIQKWALDKAENGLEKMAQANPNATEQDVIKMFEAIFDSIKDPFQDWIEEIESELVVLQATETNKRHLKFIKKFLTAETKTNLSENLQTFYGDFQKTTALIYALNEELLHRKCEALFGNYLPTKNLVKSEK